MQFPWKARSPATFGLDYWRLSVSSELVHIWDFVPETFCLQVSWFGVDAEAAGTKDEKFQHIDRHQTWEVKEKKKKKKS